MGKIFILRLICYLLELAKNGNAYCAKVIVNTSKTGRKFHGHYIYHYLALMKHEGRSYELTARFNPPTLINFHPPTHQARMSASSASRQSTGAKCGLKLVA